MKINEFLLERYLAEYEFSAPHLLCTSDCESLSIKELLSYEEGALDDFLSQRLSYTESRGHPDLREEISKLYDSVLPDDVITFAGAEEGIFVFMNAFLKEGDHVIALYPAYQSLYEIARAIGCDVTFWEISDENGWKPDFEALKRSIRDNTKAIIINTPHNPTGFNFTEEELRELADIAGETGICIFSDEVYRGIEYDEKDRLPGIVDIYGKGVSVGVMSKAYGLAGLRIGWLVLKDSDMTLRVASFKDYTTICSSAPSEFLSTVALRNRDRVIERNLSIIRENLALLDEFFEKHSGLFEWVRPKAGSIGFVRLKTGESAEKFCRDVVEKAGVLLLPSVVYQYGDSHFRIGFGRYDMKESLQKFEEYLSDKHPSF
ncbi:aminotransferase class I/II-fold pyridoxal phosphate-dependent enzyme [Methanoplanus sp. FWC-SCC4]|uniref:Aminotransferase class I/II-fold pyridoxal phosphate-dependent enzyme n=1 Tax=Methanochimaera problematica TaxID=2609417 RepID=A0AA97I4A4_9EURY|nr:aminotransferase class I/II-fold pyridoxal phosphate-dependent enzyme [Methanoplanus sp. FWC-SCC4]WOF16736.1 aminotransferase class I/II-fold pyridoxal phosphate-dependent enzyme [Methanoplanus sp. FWC-SCC4]